MTEPELRTILKSLDAALEVFQKQRGILTAAEISVKSMLTVLRTRVAEQLSWEKARAED